MGPVGTSHTLYFHGNSPTGLYPCTVCTFMATILQVCTLVQSVLSWQQSCRFVPLYSLYFHGNNPTVLYPCTVCTFKATVLQVCKRVQFVPLFMQQFFSLYFHGKSSTGLYTYTVCTIMAIVLQVCFIYLRGNSSTSSLYTVQSVFTCRTLFIVCRYLYGQQYIFS